MCKPGHGHDPDGPPEGSWGPADGGWGQRKRAPQETQRAKPRGGLDETLQVTRHSPSNGRRLCRHWRPVASSGCPGLQGHVRFVECCSMIRTRGLCCPILYITDSPEREHVCDTLYYQRGHVQSCASPTAELLLRGSFVRQRILGFMDAQLVEVYHTISASSEGPPQLPASFSLGMCDNSSLFLGKGKRGVL